MRKIQLALDELHVETFAVLPSEGDSEGTVLARSGTITNDYSQCPFVCPASYYCGPVTLESVQCTYYCEHGPGWTQYCPEEVPETLVDPGC